MPWPLLAALLASSALPGQSRLESAVQEAIAGSCGHAHVSIDRDLSRAARAFVAAAASSKVPISSRALTFYAQLESSQPAPVSGVATVSPPSTADRAVGDLFPKSCAFDRIGVAAAVLRSGGAVVAAVVAAHGAELDRIPGHLEKPGEVAVAGRLASGLVSPRLFVTRPGAEVEEVPLSVAGPRFSARVALPHRGEYSIEILAQGEGGPRVAALRRVFVGVRPPSTPPREAARGTDLAAVESAIGRLRASHGLPPVRRDPVLDEVARRHSAEMARLRRFAHVLPTDGSLADRMEKGGYPYRSAGENIGLSADPLSAHEAIVGSPAHLANLLDPRHRRVGLGAVSGPTPDGLEGVYLTEVFAAPIQAAPDPAGAVASALQRERLRHRLPALRRDPALDAIAIREVRDAAGGSSPEDQRDLPRRILDQVPGLTGAAAELMVASAAEDTASSKHNAEPRWTRLGVGALYANSEVAGTGRLWVVLVYAR